MTGSRRFHLFGLIPVGPRVPWHRSDLRWPWRVLGWHR